MHDVSNVPTRKELRAVGKSFTARHTLCTGAGHEQDKHKKGKTL